MTERENMANVGALVANANDAELEQLQVKLTQKKNKFLNELSTA